MHAWVHVYSLAHHGHGLFLGKESCTLVFRHITKPGFQGHAEWDDCFPSVVAHPLHDLGQPAPIPPHSAAMKSVDGVEATPSRKLFFRLQPAVSLSLSPLISLTQKVRFAEVHQVDGVLCGQQLQIIENLHLDGSGGEISALKEDTQSDCLNV